MDAFAIHLWPSKHYERIGYEVKVSWGDLIHELEHPEKRAQAYLVTHRFYFAVPEELAARHRRRGTDGFGRVSKRRAGSRWEKLGGAGLIAVSENGSSRIEFEAAKREAWPMPDTLIASLLRNLRRDVERRKQAAIEYDEDVA